MDAVLTVATANVCVYGYRALVDPYSGFPLAGIMLGFASEFGCLPTSIYVTRVYDIYASEITLLFLLVDALQYMTHICSHRIFYSSHKLHHAYKTPTPADAFKTGIVDAVFQLLLPIVVAIHILETSRGSLIFFGSSYSIWLQFIHSQHAFQSYIFVSPKYHHVHHRNPTKNYGHLFTVWDYLFGTIQWPSAEP